MTASGAEVRGRRDGLMAAGTRGARTRISGTQRNERTTAVATAPCPARSHGGGICGGLWPAAGGAMKRRCTVHDVVNIPKARSIAAPGYGR